MRRGIAIAACSETLINSIRMAEAHLNGEKPVAFAAIGETIEITKGLFQGLISRGIATEDRVSILLKVLGGLNRWSSRLPSGARSEDDSLSCNRFVTEICCL